MSSVLLSVHRENDDLLTAGLGIDGLRAMTPPPFADPLRPTAIERRRRAIWANWRGIADLSSNGGYGVVYGSTAHVPGREFSTLLTVEGATQPHRVLLQLPDAFDVAKRCLVVTVASGSRGIYGGIAVGAAWGLPRGCAVVHTDKAAGTDYFDIDAAEGVDLAADRVAAAAATAFHPSLAGGASGVAFKHAHSQDNPEADWGRHVRQAAEFAFQQLEEALPAQAPFTFANTRIIAVGISNGGGAVLRAAELESDWLDGVVAAEPNIHVAGSRPLYDYATEAALLMPAALLDMPVGAFPQPPLRAQSEAGWIARCAILREAGLVDGATVQHQAASARAQLHASGWTDAAIAAGAASVGFDLWRAVAAAYASAYGRFAAGAHPCGMVYTAVDSDCKPRAATALERASWWSDGSGIPPGNGIALLDRAGSGEDAVFAGLQSLRALWTGYSDAAQRVRAGIAATQAAVPRKNLPVLVIHGDADGLVPPAFSSIPYVNAAREAGADIAHWRIRNAQHFDAFLAFPDYGSRYLPMLPYVYAGLDQVWSRISGGAGPVCDALIDAAPDGDAAPTLAGLQIPG